MTANELILRISREDGCTCEPRIVEQFESAGVDDFGRARIEMRVEVYHEIDCAIPANED